MTTTIPASGESEHGAIDPARLRRIIMQHARSLESMKIDSLPLARARTSTLPDIASASQTSTGVIEPKPAHTSVLPARSPHSPQAPQQTAQIAALPTAPTSAAPPAHSTVQQMPKAQPRRGKSVQIAPRPSRLPSEDEREYRGRCLAQVRTQYETDEPHKHFVTHFRNIVWGEGDPCASICFVGEAPGEDEDLSGRPFVGRSGELLEKMIIAMGLSRERVYICNILKTRPDNNATPTTSEIEACRPYLFEQLSIVAPEAIVTLGLSSTKALLQSDASMASLRGRWTSLALPHGVTCAVMPTYHPAFLLRSYSPENRAKVWSDLCLVLQRLGMPIPARGVGGARSEPARPDPAQEEGST